DLVKRPSARAAELSRWELEAGAEALAEKLAEARPRIACLHGLTAYRPLYRLLAPTGAAPLLGLQLMRLGPTPLFVVPNPSPANAHFPPADQAEWYDRLAAALESMAASAVTPDTASDASATGYERQGELGYDGRKPGADDTVTETMR